MQILYILKGLSFQDVAGTKKNTDIHELALLDYCDGLGREGADAEEEKKVNVFLNRLKL